MRPTISNDKAKGRSNGKVAVVRPDVVNQGSPSDKINVIFSGKTCQRLSAAKRYKKFPTY